MFSTCLVTGGLNHNGFSDEAVLHNGFSDKSIPKHNGFSGKAVLSTVGSVIRQDEA